jgi:hypothetical protein
MNTRDLPSPVLAAIFKGFGGVCNDSTSWGVGKNGVLRGSGGASNRSFGIWAVLEEEQEGKTHILRPPIRYPSRDGEMVEKVSGVRMNHPSRDYLHVRERSVSFRVELVSGHCEKEGDDR